MVAGAFSSLACTLIELASKASSLEDFLDRAFGVMPVRRHAMRIDLHGEIAVAGLSTARLAGFRERWPIYARELAPISARAELGAVVDASVLGRRLFERTTYWNELARPLGLGASLVAPLRLSGRRIGTFVLSRDGWTFDADEYAVIETVLPTLSVCAAALVVSMPHAHRESEAALSAREREVASYLSLGLTNADIAVATGTSVNTVRNHVASILRKLGAANRTEAVGMLVKPTPWDERSRR
jgi:DNA-binding CsgD family transcriptional regulator